MKKKTARRFVLLIALFPVAVYAYGWINLTYFDKIDTEEVDRYYDILTEHAPKANTLTLSLGLDENSDLQTALDRMKNEMGLGKYSISLEFGDQETPPAYVTNINNDYMIITVSNKV